MAVLEAKIAKLQAALGKPGTKEKDREAANRVIAAARAKIDELNLQTTSAKRCLARLQSIVDGLDPKMPDKAPEAYDIHGAVRNAVAARVSESHPLLRTVRSKAKDVSIRALSSALGTRDITIIEAAIQNAKRSGATYADTRVAQNFVACAVLSAVAESKDLKAIDTALGKCAEFMRERAAEAAKDEKKVAGDKTADAKRGTAVSGKESKAEITDGKVSVPRQKPETKPQPSAANAVGNGLPYGGDIQAAMRARDTKAIRQIMAARKAGTGVKGSAQTKKTAPTSPAKPSQPQKQQQQQQSAADGLPYGGDIQAAMRARDTKAIRQIMAARKAGAKLPSGSVATQAAKSKESTPAADGKSTPTVAQEQSRPAQPGSKTAVDAKSQSEFDRVLSRVRAARAAICDERLGARIEAAIKSEDLTQLEDTIDACDTLRMEGPRVDMAREMLHRLIKTALTNAREWGLKQEVNAVMAMAQRIGLPPDTKELKLARTFLVAETIQPSPLRLKKLPSTDETIIAAMSNPKNFVFELQREEVLRGGERRGGRGVTCHVCHGKGTIPCCSRGRSGDKKREAKRKSVDQVDPAFTLIACSTCTFDNVGTATQCSVCGEKLDVSRRRVSVAASGGKVVGDVADNADQYIIPCGICTFNNPGTRSRCEMCGEGLDASKRRPRSGKSAAGGDAKKAPAAGGAKAAAAGAKSSGHVHGDTQCWMCGGTGNNDKWRQSLKAPEPDEAKPCRICFCGSEYGLTTECDHFYCGDCIRLAFQAMLDQGQFPAYCPQCRVESGREGKAPTKGKIEGKALTFLRRRGVISKELQFRFMKQQLKGEEKFFACPAKCGNYLMHERAERRSIIVEGKSGPVQKEILRLGQCHCGALVCTACLMEIDAQDAETHDCMRGAKKGEEIDAKTLAMMKKVGKKCPNCGNFIMKASGCDIMMCGSNAHGSLRQAIERGGCGHQFFWSSGKPANTFYIGADGKRKTGYISAEERMQVMKSLGKV